MTATVKAEKECADEVLAGFHVQACDSVLSDTANADENSFQLGDSPDKPSDADRQRRPSGSPAQFSISTPPSPVRLDRASSSPSTLEKQDLAEECAGINMRHEATEMSPVSRPLGCSTEADLSCSRNCAVCMTLPLHQFTLPCGHCFCQDCLLKSIASFSITRCPLCLGELFAGQDDMTGVCLASSEVGLDHVNSDMVDGRAKSSDPQLSSLLKHLPRVRMASKSDCWAAFSDICEETTKGSVPRIPRGESGLSGSWRIRTRTLSQESALDREIHRQNNCSGRSNCSSKFKNKAKSRVATDSWLGRWCCVSMSTSDLCSDSKVMTSPTKSASPCHAANDQALGLDFDDDCHSKSPLVAAFDIRS